LLLRFEVAEVPHEGDDGAQHEDDHWIGLAADHGAENHNREHNIEGEVARQSLFGFNNGDFRFGTQGGLETAFFAAAEQDGSGENEDKSDDLNPNHRHEDVRDRN